MGAIISKNESTFNEKFKGQENINPVLEPNFDWASVKEKNNDGDNDEVYSNPDHVEKNTGDDKDNLSDYVFPKEIQEGYRVHSTHFALKHVCNGNYKSPLKQHLKPGSKILDVGCGLGLWCEEMANEFPDVMVYGIDILSNFSPKIKPYNCKFFHGNVIFGLPWVDNNFDYIWSRQLFTEIKSKNWLPLLLEMYRVLKPGGIIEFQGGDGYAFSAGPLLEKVQFNCLQAALESQDIDLRIARKLGEIVKLAGFKDINESYQSIAIGNWGGKVGEIWASDLKDSYLTMQPWLSSYINISEDEYNRTIKEIVDKELDTHKTYINHHIIRATKKYKYYFI
ncbi:S-adenosyl-L-methionine-dependent methyltransferase [Glomus cerebriforme]|uniref:S-adenosyl-L-methionine-dependent methyltransferase n=1 Tax=Glomus cerebriforme TaxID=658196 RepID=A0A397SUI5_9GLOM|nr:S-adenosyl-L-methionine-dependent methyltransferase [Glomus cerebriforme]